jgi:methionyl-tRNA synthetase
MPETGQKMFRQIGIAQKKELQNLKSLESWGGLPGGTRTFRGPALFPRIEEISSIEEIREKAEGKREKPATSSGQGDQAPKDKDKSVENVITFDDFVKVEIVTGKVLEAEKVPKSKKLIKLIVDTGEKRQIVAGIAEYYEAEDLVGRTIAVVGNLAPAKLMGVESNGMLLAAHDDDGLALVSFDKEVKAGVRIK